MREGYEKCFNQLYFLNAIGWDNELKKMEKWFNQLYFLNGWGNGLKEIGNNRKAIPMAPKELWGVGSTNDGYTV